MTRVTSGRRSHCSRSSAAERSRLPSLTKMISYGVASASSAGYSRANSAGRPASSLYTGMTTDSTGTPSVDDSFMVFADDLGTRVADAVDVRCVHPRVQRQCERFAGDALGVRELAFVMTERAAERRQMQRLVRHAGRDPTLGERVAKRLAGDRHPVERQQDIPHVPGLAVVLAGPRRQHARGIGREALEIAIGERTPLGEELRQPRELRDADACVDVGQVELAAGKAHVARAVGQAQDAVEAKLLDALGFGRV